MKTFWFATLFCLLPATAAGDDFFVAPDAPYFPYSPGGTVQGSYAHGFADVVRSAGYYLLLASEAAKNGQQAYSRLLDNRVKRVKSYHAAWMLNQQHRESQRRRLYAPKTAEDYARLARSAAPRRLESRQLDPITGYIVWPRLLREPQYDELRDELEDLFARRANQADSIGNRDYFRIRQASGEMLGLLKAGVTEVRPLDYISARKFLVSLGYEAGFDKSAPAVSGKGAPRPRPLN